MGSVWAIINLQGSANGFLFTAIGRFFTGIQQSLAAADRAFELLDREDDSLRAAGCLSLCQYPDVRADNIGYRSPAVHR